ncbi:hypothetical protein ACVWZV_005499 [Bradyrhizobium sp. GM5.1]
MLGLVDVARGQGRIARDQIGAAEFLGVDHLARQEAPFDPPFVEIVEPARILRCRQHELGGFRKFLLAAQQLDLAEDEARIAVQLARHGFEQRTSVRRFLEGGDAGFGECDIAGPEALCSPQCGLVLAAVEQRIHPRLLIAGRQQRAELVECVVFGLFRHRVAAPGIAHQTFGVGTVAARQHRLGEREAALGGHGGFVLEPRPRDLVVAPVVPHRGLQAPAQEGLRGPARIGGQEGAVALHSRAIVLAAKDDPFREFSRDRIRDRGRGTGGVARLALAHELDHGLQRVLVGLRRRGGRSNRSRCDRLARGGMLAGRRSQDRSRDGLGGGRGGRSDDGRCCRCGCGLRDRAASGRLRFRRDSRSLQLVLCRFLACVLASILASVLGRLLRGILGGWTGRALACALGGVLRNVLAGSLGRPLRGVLGGWLCDFLRGFLGGLRGCLIGFGPGGAAGRQPCHQAHDQTGGSPCGARKGDHGVSSPRISQLAQDLAVQDLAIFD